MRKALAAAALLGAGILAATALPAAPGTACPANAYAHGMAQARTAYFAKHRGARQRAAFVAAQKAKLAALRASVACTATTATTTTTAVGTGPVTAPAPVAATHFVYGDEMPQADRDRIEQDVAYAIQDENALLGVQFGDVSVFASADPSWLGHHQCDFDGHSDEGCYSIKSARYAGKHNAAEGGPGGIFLNWIQPDLSQAEPRLLQKVLAHELFHTLQYQLDGLVHDGETPSGQVRQGGPVWLHEGAPEVVGWHVTSDRQLQTYASELGQELASWKSTSLTLDQLQTVDQSNANGNPYGLYMVAADHLVAIAPDGLKSLVAYYQALRRGLAWPDAFASAFGLSVDAFSANFAAYLKSS